MYLKMYWLSENDNMCFNRIRRSTANHIYWRQIRWRACIRL